MDSQFSHVHKNPRLECLFRDWRNEQLDPDDIPLDMGPRGNTDESFPEDLTIEARTRAREHQLAWRDLDLPRLFSGTAHQR